MHFLEMCLYNLVLFFLLFDVRHVFADKGKVMDIDLRSHACDDQLSGNNNCERAGANSWIKVNGKDAMSTRTGWNIVVVDHYTGKIESRKTFDSVFLPWVNDAKMANFIKSIPNKKIILGVAHNEGGHSLSQAGLAALNSIGGNGFVKKFRSATAFIGYKDDDRDLLKIRQKVITPRYKGPAYLRTTIGKLVKGKVLHFTLQSLGYTDRGPLSYHQMAGKTWISYKKERFVGNLGLNLMIVNHRTGAVHAKKTYNTHNSPHQGFLAYNYLKRLPQNMIILGVVHSDWTLNRYGSLEKHLRSLVKSRVQVTYDAAWAFVGYTGHGLPFTLSRLAYPRDRIANKFTVPTRIHYFTTRYDEDECKTGKAKCGENTICVNFPGSYVCECKEGFEKRGNGCKDIDECKDGTAFCGSLGTCSNSPGSYSCSCTASKALRSMGFTCNDLAIKVTSTACYHDSGSQRQSCLEKPIQIWVNGGNKLPKPQKGFNIAVLNSRTGVAEEIKSFDVSRGESSKMARYLNSVAKYKIVVGAILAKHAKHVGNDVAAAIRRLTGINAKVTGFMGAFAFIGFTGPGVPTWSTAKSTSLMKGPIIAKARLWLLPKPPFMPLRLVSLGYARGKSVQPSLGFMEMDYSKHLKPGFNIAVLNDWTGSPELIGQFNTHDKSAPDVRKMEQFLNSLPVDRMVVGVVKGDAYKGIQQNANIKKAMKRILGAPMKLKTVGGSYAFIGSTFSGKKQKPPYVDQVAFESGKGQAMLSPIIGLNWKPTKIKINLKSTGCNAPGPHKQPKTECHRAKSSINVDGAELSLNGRGVNVVVINGVNGHILHRRKFNTAKSPSECNKMADFVNSLPKTSIIVGVVKDDAYGYFDKTRVLTIAMKRILGEEAKPFVKRGSYAFIGYKGKTKQSWVGQKYSLDGKASTELAATIDIKPEISIELVSTTCSDPGAGPCHRNKNSIKVNGREYSKNGRGFNIVTIDIETGDVEHSKNFDTWASKKTDSKKMELFLAKLPANRIVLGVIKDEGYNALRDGAKKAIATLLHKKSIALNGFRQSYVFIGYTSMQPFQWIQEKRTLKSKGPIKLKIGIPLPQAGCVFPNAPQNGIIKRIEYDMTQSADYKCNKGLVLFGKPQTCSKRGKWAGSLPRCVKPSKPIKKYKSTNGELFSGAVEVQSFSTRFLLLFPLVLISWNFVDLLGN